MNLEKMQIGIGYYEGISLIENNKLNVRGCNN